MEFYLGVGGVGAALVVDLVIGDEGALASQFRRGHGQMRFQAACSTSIVGPVSVVTTV